jgi:hypothetical protein
LNLAADQYDKEVQRLLKGIGDVPSAQTYPDSLPPKEMRDHQIDALRDAQMFEKNAIESLRKAL